MADQRKNKYRPKPTNELGGHAADFMTSAKMSTTPTEFAEGNAQAQRIQGVSPVTPWQRATPGVYPGRRNSNAPPNPFTSARGVGELVGTGVSTAKTVASGIADASRQTASDFAAGFREGMGLPQPVPAPATAPATTPEGAAAGAGDFTGPASTFRRDINMDTGNLRYDDGKGSFLEYQGTPAAQRGSFNVVPSQYITSNPLSGQLSAAKRAAAARGDFSALRLAEMSPQERNAEFARRSLEEEANRKIDLDQGFEGFFGDVARKKSANARLTAIQEAESEAAKAFQTNQSDVMKEQGRNYRAAATKSGTDQNRLNQWKLDTAKAAGVEAQDVDKFANANLTAINDALRKRAAESGVEAPQLPETGWNEQHFSFFLGLMKEMDKMKAAQNSYLGLGGMFNPEANIENALNAYYGG